MSQLNYTFLQRKLHWVIALLMVTAIGLGLYMESQPYSPTIGKIYGIHKSLGVLILGLVFIRVFARLQNRVAPLGTLPKWQKIAAHLSHKGLYFFMFLMPLSGWGMSSAGGFKVSFFNLFTLPPLVEKNRELARTLSDVHTFAGWAVIGLISLHILAALYHHFVLKNDTLKRMLKRV